MDTNSYLSNKIGYRITNFKLFKNALTHLSMNVSVCYSYERLEFLGDRVLGLVISEILYLKFPNDDEGYLSKRFSHMVNQATLVTISKDLNLSKIIFFEGGNCVTHSILSDVCESLVAALYLDVGLEVTKLFIIKYWGKYLNVFEKPQSDAKTTLQEWSQLHYKSIPLYTVVRTSGPSHAPIFVVEVIVSGGKKSLGKGSSKREAKHNAALSFLDKYLGKN